MKTSTIALVVIVLLVAAGGWYFFTQKAQMPVAPSGQTQTAGNAEDTDYMSDAGTASETALMSATVTLTDSGFLPATVTIAKGGTVTWVNQSGKPIWVASAMHPDHVVYDGTTRSGHCASSYSGAKPFDECTASTADYSFTFDKTGTWGYHDHVNASHFGKVVVQ